MIDLTSTGFLVKAVLAVVIFWVFVIVVRDEAEARHMYRRRPRPAEDSVLAPEAEADRRLES